MKNFRRLDKRNTNLRKLEYLKEYGKLYKYTTSQTLNYCTIFNGHLYIFTMHKSTITQCDYSAKNLYLATSIRVFIPLIFSPEMSVSNWRTLPRATDT